MIDLHSHTLASDGEWSPKQLVDAAVAAGLSAISITDHDTIASYHEARRLAAGTGLRVIPGVEVSSEYNGQSLHLLGYFVDPDDAEFRARLESVQAAREARTPKLLARLKSLGMELTLEDIASEASGVVGRPHVAAAMVKRGYCETIPEAFDQYLADGKPAYVPKDRVIPRDAIRWIHDAGGIAVIAHPRSLKSRMRGLSYGSIIGSLALDGLDGVECYYSSHNDRTRDELMRVAARMKLCITGGSDFHGPTVRAGVTLGRGYGKLSIPDKLLDGMIKARQRRHGHGPEERPACLS
ncbi:MAG: phosphoesterase [Myxococcales bacterium]|nr:phosphoesterase [Myxococcales bacterium]